ARTHARANVLHPRGRRQVLEPAVPIAVEIIAAKVIGYVKGRPATAVIVAPGRGETESVVVLIQTCRGGDVLEKAAAIGGQAIVKQVIGRAITGVVIWGWISVLVLALEVDVGV